MNYFIRRDTEEYGPYTLADLQRYVASGNISLEEPAHAEGDPSLLRVGDLLSRAAAAYPAAGTGLPPGSLLPGGMPGTMPGGSAMPGTIPPGAYLPAYQVPRMANGAPLPPNFHWGWLLLLHFPTCGVITFVWLFLQAWWVRQLDPTSRAIWYFGAYLGISYVIGIPISVAMNLVAENATADSQVIIIVLVALVFLISIGSLVLFLIGAFSMRRSMLNYFNSVESIGLRLSGVMTFFFPIWYFQYHMTRIAEWKKTGTLPV